MNAPCNLVPIDVAMKERGGRISARPAAGGWQYLRCSACSLRVWIPPGGEGAGLLCKAPPAPAVS